MIFKFIKICFWDCLKLLYHYKSGKGSFEDTVPKTVVAKSMKDAESNFGTWSFSEKFDWVKIVNDIMQSEYSYVDLKDYTEWKKFLGFPDK